MDNIVDNIVDIFQLFLISCLGDGDGHSVLNCRRLG